MPINLERTRALLQSFDFKALFIEEPGWDRYTSTLDISIDGQNYTLWAMRFAVCYMKTVNFLKRHEGLDVYDYDTQFNPLLIGG